MLMNVDFYSWEAYVFFLKQERCEFAVRSAINAIGFFLKQSVSFVSCMHAQLESIEFLSTIKITNISMMATCTVCGD